MVPLITESLVTNVFLCYAFLFSCFESFTLFTVSYLFFCFQTVCKITHLFLDQLIYNIS